MSPRARRIASWAVALTTACGSDLELGADRRLAIEPAPLLFSGVAVGDSDSLTARLRHVGTRGALTVTAVTLETDSADLSLGEVRIGAIEPGAELTVSVRFAPSDGAADVWRLQVSAEGLPDTIADVLAPAPTPLLRAIPGQLVFGDVPVTTTPDRTVEIENAGLIATTVLAVGLDAAIGAPFSIVQKPNLPITLGIGERFAMVVRYAPVPGERDETHAGWVRVRTEDAADNTAVPLTAVARNVQLHVEPPSVSFGWVSPGDSASAPVAITNEGTRPIAIAKLALEGAVDVALIGAPEAPLVLGAGEGLSLLLRFAPNEAGRGPSLGELQIESDDYAPSPLRRVPLSGASAKPALVLDPAELVDFGVVAAFHRHERILRVRNAGGAALRVNAAALTPESDAGFFVRSAPAWPVTLSPGGEAQVRLSHQNLGQSEGVALGAITVSSDDPAAPAVTVALRARHASFPTCAPRFEPKSVEFGALALGTTSERTLTLTNDGSLPCVYRGVSPIDCLEASGACEPVFGASPFFTAAAPLPTLGTVLSFGDTLTIPLRFRAELEAGPHGALPVVTLGKGLKEDGFLQFPSPYAGGPPLLHGIAGDSGLLVTPTEVVFPLTTVACASAAAVTSALRVGEAPLSLGAVTLEGCDGAFTIEPPALPATLSTTEAVPVPIRFTPTQAGAASCEARFRALPDSGGYAIVSLIGIGAAKAERTDTFHQASQLAVDVLFVVDSSGSMGDEQEALLTGFDSLVDAAAAWSVDFQIGVVTTDPDEGGVMRRPFATNAAPWVISSRYIRMTFVAGSSLSESIKSMSLMSALLPNETNLEKPMCLACA